jgi:hypothetical protein
MDWMDRPDQRLRGNEKLNGGGEYAKQSKAKQSKAKHQVPL